MRSYRFVDYATQGYIVLVALLILLCHGQRLVPWPWLLGGHAAAVALIHGLILLANRFPTNRWLDFFRAFYPILLFTAFYREVELLNQMLHAGYLDAHFLRFEWRVFGSQPGLQLMQWWPWRWLAELLYAAYFSYYLMIGGLGLVFLLRDRRQFAHFVSVISFVFYVCYTIYIFVPVVGPRIVYSGLVQTPLPQEVIPVGVLDPPAAVTRAVFFRIMAWVYANFETAGAAFPSSHVAVAMGTLWFSFRYLRGIRFLHLIAVILLCISTVYGRYHYVVDVLGGMVTAMLLVPTADWFYQRFDGKPPSKNPAGP